MKDVIEHYTTRVTKLENRIIKTIYYINQRVNELKEDHDYITLNKDDIEKILDILKGLE